MAPRTKKTIPTTAKNDLGLSDLRLRLNFLEKENVKILKQIETNRTKLINLNDSIQEVGRQVIEKSAPLRQKASELDQKIHDIFKELLTARKFGKKSRQDIKSVYYHLQSDGLISPQQLPDDVEIFEVNDPEDDTDWRSYQENARQQFDLEPPTPDRDELKKIRQIYLRLADNFHPDKVIDEVEKEYRTEVMKEINLAYKNGDLARLLAIEKQQELGEIINRDSSDDLTRQCAKIEADNAFLINQLDNLKLQLKLTKKTQQGEMTAVFKKITKYGGDPLEQAIQEMEAHITVMEQLHQFVGDFRDRRITIKEFLRGPSSLMQEHLSEEEILLEILSKFRNL